MSPDVASRRRSVDECGHRVNLASLEWQPTARMNTTMAVLDTQRTALSEGDDDVLRAEGFPLGALVFKTRGWGALPSHAARPCREDAPRPLDAARPPVADFRSH